MLRMQPFFEDWWGSGVVHAKVWISDKKDVYICSANNDWKSLTQLQREYQIKNLSSLSFFIKSVLGGLKRFLLGGGCVAAHTPGAGKTLLLILFLVSYLKVHPRSQPLVLTPKAAIHT